MANKSFFFFFWLEHQVHIVGNNAYKMVWEKIVHDTISALGKGLRLSLWPNIPIFVNVPWMLIKIHLHFYSKY